MTRRSPEVAQREQRVDLGKHALLATRGFLLITVVIAPEHAQGEAARQALERAFGRILDFEEQMRMPMARSAIARLGRSRSTFQRAAPKIWGIAITQQQSDTLFVIYAARSTNTRQTSQPQQPAPDTLMNYWSRTGT